MEASKPYGDFSYLINISKGCALHEAVYQLSWFLLESRQGLGLQQSCVTDLCLVDRKSVV